MDRMSLQNQFFFVQKCDPIPGRIDLVPLFVG